MRTIALTALLSAFYFAGYCRTTVVIRTADLLPVAKEYGIDSVWAICGETHLYKIDLLVALELLEYIDNDNFSGGAEFFFYRMALNLETVALRAKTKELATGQFRLIRAGLPDLSGRKALTLEEVLLEDQLYLNMTVEEKKRESNIRENRIQETTSLLNRLRENQTRERGLLASLATQKPDSVDGILYELYEYYNKLAGVYRKSSEVYRLANYNCKGGLHKGVYRIDLSDSGDTLRTVTLDAVIAVIVYVDDGVKTGGKTGRTEPDV